MLLYETELDKEYFEHQIVIIFLPINLNMWKNSHWNGSFNRLNNCLIETVLLSSHNICSG